MAAFNHRIFIPPVAESDASVASSLTGMIQADNVTVNSTGSALNISPLHRPLLLPQEIASPPRDEELGPRITFLFADTPPFQGWLKAAFEVDNERPWLDNDGDLPLPKRQPPDLDGGGGAAAAPAALRPGITNTAGWTTEAIDELLKQTKASIGWDETTGSARKWWQAFENENHNRLNLVLLLAEELKVRSATITEFFLAYVYSNTDNIQANLHYLDYTRLKKSSKVDAAPAKDATARTKKPLKAEPKTEQSKSSDDQDGDGADHSLDEFLKSFSDD
jgi:hypothetical protein